MKVTTKGNITISKNIRDQLGMLPGTEVEIAVDGNSVRILPSAQKISRGAALIQHMTGLGTVEITTDEMLALTRGEN